MKYTIDPLLLHSPIEAYIVKWSPDLSKKRERDIAALLPEHRYTFGIIKSHVTVDASWESSVLKDEWKGSILRIIRGEWHVKVDKNGRLHHNLSNFPKECRQFLRLYGEVLAGLDYSALHPHLICSLLPDGEEKTKMKLWLQSDFYSPLIGSETKSRSAAKKAFNAAVNARRSDEWKFPIFARFADEFPQAATIIRDMKHTDHRDCSAFFQRLESRLIYQEVVRRCMSEQVPVITIHDCVFSRMSDQARAQLIMIEAGRTLLGLNIGSKAA